MGTTHGMVEQGEVIPLFTAANMVPLGRTDASDRANARRCRELRELLAATRRHPSSHQRQTA